MPRYQHNGGAVPTTLVTPMTDASLGTVTVDSAQGWPDGTVGLFFAVVDRGLSTEEKVLCGSRSGTEITVAQRAVDGTTAYPHGVGASIEHVFSAVEADEANAHILATDDVHGIPVGDVIASEGAVDAAILAAQPKDYAELEATQDSTDDPSLTTPVLGFPYPDSTDPLMVRRALQMLAEALDGAVPTIISGTDDPPQPATDYPDGTLYLRRYTEPPT